MSTDDLWTKVYNPDKLTGSTYSEAIELVLKALADLDTRLRRVERKLTPPKLHGPYDTGAKRPTKR